MVHLYSMNNVSDTSLENKSNLYICVQARLKSQIAAVPFFRVVTCRLQHKLPVNDQAERTGRRGTNSFSFLSLSHSFCPPFIFPSDSIDTPIHLLPQSISSDHCMLLPSIHPLNSVLIPSSSSPSLHYALFPFHCYGVGECQPSICSVQKRKGKKETYASHTTTV